MVMGRPKGIANTPTGHVYTRAPKWRTQDLIDTLEDLGYDVVAKLIATIEDPAMPLSEKMRGLLGVMTFIYPRRKAVDLEGLDIGAMARGVARMQGQLDAPQALERVDQAIRADVESPA
jgi:hypothetical protein